MALEGMKKNLKAQFKYEDIEWKHLNEINP